MLTRVTLIIIFFCHIITFQSWGQAERDTLFYEIERNMIEKAGVVKSDRKEGGNYLIRILLKEKHHSQFEKTTEEYTGSFFAVVYEGEVISTSLPVIQSKVTGGFITISKFTKEEAEEVLQKIKDREQ